MLFGAVIATHNCSRCWRRVNKGEATVTKGRVATVCTLSLTVNGSGAWVRRDEVATHNDWATAHSNFLGARNNSAAGTAPTRHSKNYKRSRRKICISPPAFASPAARYWDN